MVNTRNNSTTPPVPAHAGLGEAIGAANKQNEADLCGICRQMVEKEQPGMRCDLCAIWFHTTCLVISGKKYGHIQEGEQLKWFCKECNKSFRSLGQENKMLRDENVNLKQTNTDILAKLATIGENWIILSNN